MNCPLDQSELQPKTYGEIAVQTCPRCGGMFLEHGQLNAIAGPIRGDVEFTTVDRDSGVHDDERGPIACPHGHGTMRKVDFNIDTSIILDYCTHCHGFWLDGSELQRIRDEVKRLNEADEEIEDPLLVRISQFFWNLPIPH
jgi:Zn-finger nucleic acid-binding protein